MFYAHFRVFACLSWNDVVLRSRCRLARPVQPGVARPASWTRCARAFHVKHALHAAHDAVATPVDADVCAGQIHGASTWMRAPLVGSTLHARRRQQGVAFSLRFSSSRPVVRFLRTNGPTVSAAPRSRRPTGVALARLGPSPDHACTSGLQAGSALGRLPPSEPTSSRTPVDNWSVPTPRHGPCSADGADG